MAFSLLTLLSAACSQAGFAVVNAPGLIDGVQAFENVSYGARGDQVMDIYQPKQAAAETPVIVFFHGGRWSEGNKGQYKFVGSRLAQAGYIVVIPDYRKYPRVKFPELMEDEAEALAWVHRNIAAYKGRKDGLYVMGHSSGAHVAALLAADARYLAVHDLSPSIIRGVVGLSGPYHFTPREEDLKDMFGPPSEYPQMQLGTFIDDDTPPMFMAWGAKDTLVGKINIDNTLAAAKEKGAEPDIRVKIYDDLDHAGTIKAFTWLFEGKSALVDDVLNFIETTENTAP